VDSEHEARKHTLIWADLVNSITTYVACAIWPEEAIDYAVFVGKRQVGNGSMIAIPLRQMFDLNH
jgi:hypothetical protein